MDPGRLTCTLVAAGEMHLWNVVFLRDPVPDLARHLRHITLPELPSNRYLIGVEKEKVIIM